MIDIRDDWKSKLAVYAITDDREDTKSLLAAVEAALAGGATAIQLRRKRDDGGPMLRLGLEIRRLTREAGALYIVNDRVDIALLTEADGIHVGQTDIPCKRVRELAPDKLIGLSARTTAEALEAERDGADYVGVGAVFPTTTKADAIHSGIDTLRAIAGTSSIPVVAIGGIDIARAPQVLAAGADGLAVVSAIMSAPSPRDAARAFASLYRESDRSR
ncbi:thiamine-phosphate pyrophosphorylase [Alicyclobacillus hesperidum URH17-3-68]|uniref:thiamine phosphate synthase n=1 Tax=Alicyclobacillus hesperidum TaxID=89784 RepID=UPI000281AAEF|nr:thiamine phosphate synthase [Alicyclobacillus hesperidum]EJY57109.1 thiamine-phosphate pyrophosphorylase [Alicyclobacillus hesperidum URH17-3-68]KRW91746.1 thiamine-phosphate synthase [Alicyclobacillus tengchongensis]